MSTFHILYGFAEGTWHGKLMRQQLRQAGYHYTRFASRADIIISHSGGCFLVPKRNRAQLIMLINIPFWPGKKLTLSLREKLAEDREYHKQNDLHRHWRKKTVQNSRYGVSRAAHIGRMRRKYGRSTYPVPRTEQQKILLVRNDNDSFCSPEIMDILPQAKHYLFSSLPGGHDDCWQSPDNYINLITKNLESRRRQHSRAQ